jgi:hypothetical protein
MVELADFVESAWLTAVTTSFSATEGAVYSPVELIVPVPEVTIHVTAVLLVPDTVAVKLCCQPAGIDTVVGEMLTLTGVGFDTLTEAEADFVESATLLAVTV